MLFYDFRVANTTKNKDYGTKLKKSYVLFLDLARHLKFGCKENCYEMRSNVLIDDVSRRRTIVFVSSRIGILPNCYSVNIRRAEIIVLSK